LAGLDPAENKWELLFDFSSHRGVSFSIMKPADFKIERKTVPGLEGQLDEPTTVFGYPQRYGGVLSNAKPVSSAEHDNLSAFDIKTGQV